MSLLYTVIWVFSRILLNLLLWIFQIYICSRIFKWSIYLIFPCELNPYILLCGRMCRYLDTRSMQWGVPRPLFSGGFWYCHSTVNLLSPIFDWKGLPPPFVECQLIWNNFWACQSWLHIYTNASVRWICNTICLNQYSLNGNSNFQKVTI